jgi:hypothetical protein
MAAPRAAWRNRGTTYNGKCGGVRQSAQGEIGTYTTLAPRDEPKRWQLGPTILFDRPRPAPSTPPASDFPRGVAQRWRREQSRGASGAAVWRNFSNRGPQAGADGEGSSRRRELRWRPRERRGGIAVQRTTENAAAFGSRRRGKSVHIQRSLRGMSRSDGNWGMRRRSAVGAGWESVHIQRSLRGMSRSDGNWGPRFCSTAPAQHPTPPASDFPRGVAATPSNGKRNGVNADTRDLLQKGEM